MIKDLQKCYRFINEAANDDGLYREVLNILNRAHCF